MPPVPSRGPALIIVSARREEARPGDRSRLFWLLAGTCFASAAAAGVCPPRSVGPFCRPDGSRGRPGHRTPDFLFRTYFQVDAIHEEPFAVCNLAGLPTGGAARVGHFARDISAWLRDGNHARPVAGRCSLRAAHRHPELHGHDPAGSEAAGPARRAPCRNPSSNFKIRARRRALATLPAARQETLS